MKYSTAFFVIGTSVGYLAVSLGGTWYLLLWFSFTCFVLSCGYAGLGSRIFAKRADGTIPLWVKIAHLPYFLYSSAIWHLVVLIGRENAFDRVNDKLILGRRLGATEFPSNVVNCVDLTSEFEEPRDIVRSTNYINLPILDAGVPSKETLMNVIERLRPGITYIHCAQGHGRTGLFAIALLAHNRRSWSYEEGLSMIKAARPGIGLNQHQERFLKELILEMYGKHPS